MACADVKNGGGHGTDEVNIVTDKNERSFVLVEGCNQGVDRADIQMGGGLIHQEKVGWVEEEFDEGESGFFPSAEDSHRFEDIVSAKKKGTENGSGGLLANRVGGVEDRFKNLMLHVERITPVLGEVSDPDIMTEESFATLNGESSAQKFEKRGFAGSVGTDENRALASFGFEIKSPIHGEIARTIDVFVSVPNVFQRDDSKATADGLGKAEFDRSGSGNGGLDLIHAVDLLEFALGLGGFTRFGAETVGELLEGSDLFLLVFIGGEVLFFAGGFFDDIFVVVAAIAVKFRLGNFDDGVDEFIEKLAIVGDHQNGAGISS